MLADEVNGDFWLDLTRMQAVNFDESEKRLTVYEGEPDEPDIAQ